MPAERTGEPPLRTAVTVYGSVRLFAVRLLSTLGVQLPIGAVLLWTHHGLLVFATFWVPLVVVQIPFRVDVVDGGFSIRWTWHETVIPFEALETVTLGPDPRLWVLGRRETALALKRRRSSRLLLFGALSELEVLYAALETARAEHFQRLSRLVGDRPPR